jgi:hypothetical protein
VAISWVENIVGATAPWRVASEDHLDARNLPRHFLLKNFRVDQAKTRYVEYIATRVASELDIGAPRPELLTITSDFVGAHRLLPTPPAGLDQVLIGPQMAVPWYDDAIVLARLPYGKIHTLHSHHQPAGILATDTLLQNPDRHHGNVLVRRSGQGNRILVPIDWSLAFEGYEPIPSAFRSIANKRKLYIGGADMRRNVTGPEDFDLIRKQMEKLFTTSARIRSIVEGVPDEWKVSEKWMTTTYSHLMTRLEVTLDVLLHVGEDRNMPDWQINLPVDGER